MPRDFTLPLKGLKRVLLKMSNVCFIFLFYRKCNGNEKNIFEEKCWLTKIGQGSFWICDVYIVLW